MAVEGCFYAGRGAVLILTLGMTFQVMMRCVILCCVLHRVRIVSLVIELLMRKSVG